MPANVRIAGLSLAVTPEETARVRIARMALSVTPASTGAAKVRIAKLALSTTPAASAPAELSWRGGKWVTPGGEQIWRSGRMAPAAPEVAWHNGAWVTPAPPPPPPTPAPDLPGFQLLARDEFATLDPSRWYAYDNSTYGSDGGRVQRYMRRNAVIGPASDGDGFSLQLVSKRESVGGNPFTAGMVDSKTAGWYAPRYHAKEIDCRIAHGQGVWQAWWSTAFNGGASMFELDDGEIFHAQIPGRMLLTVHRAIGRDSAGNLLTQYNVAKSKSADGYGGIFFEPPNATGGTRHKFRTEVYPVTDATGVTAGDPDQPSAFVRIKGYVDGVKRFDWVDTNALFWTSNGGDPDDPINRFWNIYIQGSQINGKYVGHPDDPLGYSRLLNACISGGGTPPNACNTSFAGQPILHPVFPNTFEIFSHTVWKWTG